MQGRAGLPVCPLAGWETGQGFAQAGAEPVVYLTRLASAAATASEQLKTLLLGSEVARCWLSYML